MVGTAEEALVACSAVEQKEVAEWETARMEVEEMVVAGEVVGGAGVAQGFELLFVDSWRVATASNDSPGPLRDFNRALSRFVFFAHLRPQSPSSAHSSSGSS